MIALRHLESLGMKLLEMNYRYGHGEVDIIAADGETLVFCEVKSRENDEFGPPEYAISTRKQQQIRRIATGYLIEHDIKDRECRFDVVAIKMYPGLPREINYIRNAF